MVDEGEIGGGETGRTSAHLSNALDDCYFELERLHGEEGAPLAAHSHTAAISKIEALVKDLDIKCDFARLDGYLFSADEKSQKVLLKELAALERAGLNNVRCIKDAPAAFPPGPYLVFPAQAVFHPLKYLSGVAQGFIQHWGKIYIGTHVSSITPGKLPAMETRAGKKITAGSLVVATNVPINNRYVMHTKQAPYRSYVIGIEVPAGSVAKGLYWDTAEPYHYVRVADRMMTGIC